MLTYTSGTSSLHGPLWSLSHGWPYIMPRSISIVEDRHIIAKLFRLVFVL